MRKEIGLGIVVAMLAWSQAGPDPAFRYLYTFGSKRGIHPRTVLNRKVATVPLGTPDNPYGLVYPVAVAVDSRHRVWVSDSGTASVHVFDGAEGAYREIRRLADIQLRQPSGLCADSQGRIFLADAGLGAVFMFDEKGEYDHALSKRGERLFEAPGSIALSPDEKTIYVADPPRSVVVALNREGEVNQTIPLPADFAAPASLAVVGNRLAVLGGLRNRVGVFNLAGQPKGELRWDGVSLPSAFAYDAARRRFLVANPRWMTIEVFDAEGRGVASFGQAGEGVDQVQRVDFLHVDAGGRLFVVDSRHGKVLVFGDAAAHGL